MSRETPEYELLERINRRLEIMSAEMDGLVASVAVQTTVVGSIDTLLAGLSAQLAAAAASANPAAAVLAVKANIDANNAAMQAAIVANTPGTITTATITTA